MTACPAPTPPGARCGPFNRGRKEALDDLQFAISLNPSDMGAYAEIGRIRLIDGQPREALKSYDRAAALDPLNFTLQMQRCMVLDDLAQYEEAGKACERARVLQPGSASAADGLAWLAESRGRIDEALRWNAESLKAEPSDDFSLYWTRAEFFLEIGLAAPARAVVQQGRDATKNTDNADVALVRVVFLEGGAEALRSYLDAVQLERSPHALALFEAAYARLLLGDAPAVKELLARAVVAPDRDPGFRRESILCEGRTSHGHLVSDRSCRGRIGARRRLGRRSRN